MNKADLIDAVASKTGFTKKDSARAIESLLESISEALARGEKVSLVGFGTFSTSRRRSRVGRNPRTGGEITIPQRTVPVFRAGRPLKEKVNG